MHGAPDPFKMVFELFRFSVWKGTCYHKNGSGMFINIYIWIRELWIKWSILIYLVENFNRSFMTLNQEG